MVDNDIFLQGIVVRYKHPIVNIYYTDPLPVFNFTGIELSKGVTATSGIIYISTLDTVIDGLGGVAMLDLYTGNFTAISGAYSTATQSYVEVLGAAGIHRRRT